LGKAVESAEKQAMDRNPYAARWGRLKQTWKRTVLEEAGKCGEACSEVERSASNTVRWRWFTNALRSQWNERTYYCYYYYYYSKNRLERISWTASYKILYLHIITSRGTSNIILSVLLSNQAQQQVSISKQCASHVSDFRPKWATPPWLSAPSVFQTQTVLCTSRLFIGAHAIYLQVPSLHNVTGSSRRLFVNTVLNYRVSQKAEFLEYLNDYELLQDSPPSLQPFPTVPWPWGQPSP
jgi:hypothetical protein